MEVYLKQIFVIVTDPDGSSHGDKNIGFNITRFNYQLHLMNLAATKKYLDVEDLQIGIDFESMLNVVL